MTRLSKSRSQSLFSSGCRHGLLSSFLSLLTLSILATRCRSNGNTATRSPSSAVKYSLTNRDWLRLLSQLNTSTGNSLNPAVPSSAARTSVSAETGSSGRTSRSATTRMQPSGRRIHTETGWVATEPGAVGSSRQRSTDRLLQPLPSTNGHLHDITSPLIGSYHSCESAGYSPRRSLGSESLFRPGTVLAGNRRNPGRGFWRREGAAGSLLGSLFRRRRRLSTLQFPQLDSVPPLSAVNSSYTRYSSVTAKDWVEGRNATFMTPVIDHQGVSRRFRREAFRGISTREGWLLCQRQLKMLGGKGGLLQCRQRVWVRRKGREG